MFNIPFVISLGIFQSNLKIHIIWPICCIANIDFSIIYSMIHIRICTFYSEFKFVLFFLLPALMDGIKSFILIYIIYNSNQKYWLKYQVCFFFGKMSFGFDNFPDSGTNISTQGLILNLTGIYSDTLIVVFISFFQS